MPTTVREALQAKWLALLNVEQQHRARLADRMATFEQRTAEVEQPSRAA